MEREATPQRTASTETDKSPQQHPSSSLRQGQQLAFATAALMLGVASYIHLLGFEKALLAIIFGVMALRGQGTPHRRSWAWAGIAMGGLMIALLLFALIFYYDEVVKLLDHLNELGS